MAPWYSHGCGGGGGNIISIGVWLNQTGSSSGKYQESIMENWEKAIPLFVTMFSKVVCY